jgi:hypothetical protein
MLAELSLEDSYKLELFKAFVTALFIGIGAVLVVWYVQSHAARRQADRETRASLRARSSELAGAFYYATQRYRRQKADPAVWGQPNDLELDTSYAEWALSSEILETDLGAVFGHSDEGKADKPAELWHQVRDLFVVRYHHLRDSGGASDRLREINSKNYQGKYHSGLTDAELAEMSRILATYRTTMTSLATAIRSETMGE